MEKHTERICGESKCLVFLASSLLPPQGMLPGEDHSITAGLLFLRKCGQGWAEGRRGSPGPDGSPGIRIDGPFFPASCSFPCVNTRMGLEVPPLTFLVRVSCARKMGQDQPPLGPCRGSLGGSPLAFFERSHSAGAKNSGKTVPCLAFRFPNLISCPPPLPYYTFITSLLCS